MTDPIVLPPGTDQVFTAPAGERLTVTVANSKKSARIKVSGGVPVPDPTPVIGMIAGYGVDVTGGDLFADMPITTPAETGPGSFAYLCQGSNRKITSAIEGEIHLPTNIAIRGANVTVDLSTAPGKGAWFSGDTIQPSYGARNIKLVDFRHRGRGPTALNEGDCISPTRDVSGLLIARVSLSGHNDECIGMWDRVKEVTIQDVLIGPGQSPAHNYHVLAGMFSEHISLHHSILYNGKYRNPAIGWEGEVAGVGGHAPDLVGDVVGNLIADFIDYGLTVYNDGNANFIKNYVYGRTRNVGEQSARGQGFWEGNYSPNGTFPVSNHQRFAVPLRNRIPEDDTALLAARSDLEKAGCRTHGGLDAFDQGIVAQIKLDRPDLR